MKAAKIVFADQNGEGMSLTQGTKVVLEDGTELQGVRKIVLTAEVNDIWRADITCGVNLTGEVGAAVDVTSLASAEREWKNYPSKHLPQTVFVAGVVVVGIVVALLGSVGGWL